MKVSSILFMEVWAFFFLAQRAVVNRVSQEGGGGGIRGERKMYSSVDWLLLLH